MEWREQFIFKKVRYENTIFAILHGLFYSGYATVWGGEGEVENLEKVDNLKLYFDLLGDEADPLSIEEFLKSEQSVDSFYAPNQIFPLAISNFSVNELGKLRRHINESQKQIFVATDAWNTIKKSFDETTVEQEATVNWLTGENSIGMSDFLTAVIPAESSSQFTIGSFSLSPTDFIKAINSAQLYVKDENNTPDYFICSDCYQYYGYPDSAVAEGIFPGSVAADRTDKMVLDTESAVKKAIKAGIKLDEKPTVDLISKDDLVTAIDDQIYDKLIEEDITIERPFAPSIDLYYKQ